MEHPASAPPKPERETVHVRMPRDLLKRLDHWAVEEDLPRDRAVTFLVRLALDNLNFQWPKS